jgi:hypothetical protein
MPIALQTIRSLFLKRERDMLVFELRDDAPPSTREDHGARPAECRPGGLFLPIRTLMDDWQPEPDGRQQHPAHAQAPALRRGFAAHT